MNFLINRLLFLSLFFYGNLFSLGTNSSIFSIVGSSLLYEGQDNVGVLGLQSLESAPNCNQDIVISSIVNEIQQSMSGPDSIIMTGSLIFNNNILTIALPASISQLQISGSVVINVPVGGTFEITVNGVPYDASIPGLSVLHENSSHSFEVNVPVTIRGSLIEHCTCVTIDGSLPVTMATDIDTVDLDGSSALTVTEDIAVDGNNLGYVRNSGTIIATESITMNNLIDTEPNGAGVSNDGSIQSNLGNITMNNNIGGDNGAGVCNEGSILALGDIIMNNNGDPATDGVGVLNASFGSVTTTSGSITMNGNSGGVASAGESVGFGNQGIISAYGDITMNNNSNTNVNGTGLYNDVGASITSTFGSITMNGNVGGSASSAGVYSHGTISVVGDITMNNNIGGASNNGVLIDTGAVLQTNGTFTITIANDAAQLFDSSAVTINRTDGTTVVHFSSFAVTVGGISYVTYGAIPVGRVNLAVGNQS